MTTVSCNITGGQPPPHEYTAPNWTDTKRTAINVTPAIPITIKAWTPLFKQIQPIIVSSTIIIRVGLERSKPSDGHVLEGIYLKQTLSEDCHGSIRGSRARVHS